MFVALTSALCGICWGHNSAEIPSPTDQKFVELCLEGAIRQASESLTKNKKEPLTPEILIQKVKLYGSNNNLLHLRFIVVRIGILRILRIGELKERKLKDIHQNHEGIKINVL